MTINNFKITVVVDVFRAFTTACYILEREPSSYFYTYSCKIVEKLTHQTENSLLIGKPEKGSTFNYQIPNSPKWVTNEFITNRNVIHRTESGARGILAASHADLVLATGLVNAKATVDYIKIFKNSIVTILPMGHEGTTPSLEDDICAHYLLALLTSKHMDISSYIPKLALSSGKYFFSDDQNQYPKEDFSMCLELNKFNFAIQAHLYSKYAILKRCHIPYLSDTFETKAVSILSKNHEFPDLSNVIG